jgi:diguanylate cyclase
MTHGFFGEWNPLTDEGLREQANCFSAGPAFALVCCPVRERGGAPEGRPSVSGRRTLFTAMAKGARGRFFLAGFPGAVRILFRKIDSHFNLLTLRFFDKDLEADFRNDCFVKSLKKDRTAALVGAFLYAIFGILDWVVIPDKRQVSWIIRYGFVCPLLIWTYFFSFTGIYRKLQKLNIFFVGFASSLGLITIICIASSPGNYLYYAGLLLCVLFYYAQIPDHLISNCLAWSTFFLYVAASYLFTGIPGFFLFNNSFIFFFFNIAGMFVCYSLEISRRSDYLQRLTIQQQAEQLRQALYEVESERRKAEQLSLKDPLTGLANRRHFFAVAAKEFERKNRHRHSLTVMLLDIDHFKNVNDTYGHGVGDQVLQKVADTITGTIRSSDLACRFGGEEFAVLLPETDREAAIRLGERLLRNIEQGGFATDKGAIFISASMGIAALAEEEEASSNLLLERADQMLYQAKNAGRNQLRVWSLPPEKSFGTHGSFGNCNV